MTEEDLRRLAVAERAARAGGALALRRFRTPLSVETKAGPTDYVTGADRDAQARIESVIRSSYPGEPIVGEESQRDDPAVVPDRGPAWVVDPIDGTNNFVRSIPIWTTSVAVVLDGEPIVGVSVIPTTGDAYVAGVPADPAGHGTATAASDGNGDGDGVSRSRLNDEPIAVSDVDDPALGTVSPIMWQELHRRDRFIAAGDRMLRRFDDVRRFGSAQFTLAMVASGGLEGVVTDVTADPWDTIAGVHLIRRAGGRVTDVDGDPWRPDSQGLVASNGPIHDSLLAVFDDSPGDGRGTSDPDR